LRALDPVMYGERGRHAFEVTRSSIFGESDLRACACSVRTVNLPLGSRSGGVSPSAR